MKSPNVHPLWIVVVLVALALMLRLTSVPIVIAPTETPPRPAGAAFDAIQQSYLEKIKPIFVAKCLICHGQPQRVPLYGRVFPFSLLIQHNIAEAHEDFDMSHDFPFVAKGTYAEQLKTIRWVVEHNSMPPLEYRLMHWGDTLSAAEKKTVLAWVEESLKRLE